MASNDEERNGTELKRSFRCMENGKIPRCLDEILVLWEVDVGFIWWSAQVLSSRRITNVVHDDRQVIGFGTLRYDAQMEHDQVDHDVEFLFSTNGETLVREKHDSNSDQEATPCLWQIKVQEEAEEHDDINWSASKTSPSNSRKQQKKRPASKHVDKKHMKRDGEFSDLLGAYEHLSNRVTALENVGRSPRTALTPHVQQLKVCLRSKLFRRFQGTFKPKGVLNSGREGLAGDAIRVSSDCTLSWFADVSRDIYRMCSEDTKHDIHFNPSMHATFHPSRASSILEVRLTSFRAICKWLDIRDEGDIQSILCRMGEQRQKSYIRILGSLSHASSYVDGTEGVSVHSIAIGHSLNNLTSENAGRVRQRDDDERDGRHKDAIIDDGASEDVHESTNVIFFEQECRNWDESLGRFLTSWNKQERTIRKSDLAYWRDHSTSEHPSFSIVWRRSSSPSGRTWSSDASHTSGEIPGRIEIFMPCVICYGNTIANEIFRLFMSHNQKLHA